MKKFLFIVMALAVIGCAAPVKKMETVFIPPLPQQPKLQFLLSISDETDLGKKPNELAQYLLGQLVSTKRLARPYAIGAVKGKIYVIDKNYKTIIILDLEENEFKSLETKRKGRLIEPVGLWVSEDGHKYIADMGRKQIVVYDKDDKFVRTYGSKDLFDRPLDVAVYKNRIYVNDYKKHNIQVLDKDSGEVIQTIGMLGTTPGAFYKPTHITVDKDGNLYVNDSFNFRIQKLDPEGNFIKSFGLAGDTLGTFARPKGIAVDRENYLYAVDAAFENVQIFDDKTTDLVLFFGGFDAGLGSMYLPNGIYIDYQNIEYFQKYVDKDFRVKYLVYVANSLGYQKLNVYAFGEWTGPPLTEEE